MAPNAKRTPRAPPASESSVLSVTKQATAPGADRHSHRHLSGPRGAAGELEVRDVRTRDQQEKPDRAEQELKARAHFAAGHGHVEIVPQPGGETLRWKCGGLLLRQALMECLQLFLGRSRGDAGRQPHDGIHKEQIGSTRSERKPEPVVAVPAKTRRHYADDGVRPAVELHRPADRRRTALEEAQPQAVAQHHNRFGQPVRANVRRLNRSPDNGWHAEEIEGVAGQEDPVETLRREFPRQEHRFLGSGHDIGKRWDFR